MRRTISLSAKGIERLEAIKKDLRKTGVSKICPEWTTYTLGTSERLRPNATCRVCEELFPRVKLVRCPCYTYKASYLIRRLNEIIRYNETLIQPEYRKED